MEILGLFGLLLVTIVICTGAAHASCRLSMKKEAGWHLSGATSNRRDSFQMVVEKVQKGPVHTTVEGFLRGPYPVRGNVLYLLAADERKPVFLLRILQQPARTTENAIYVRMSLFGARDICEGEILNNKRLPEQLEPVEFTFPVTARKNASQLLWGIFILLMAVLLFAMTVYSFSNGSSNALVAVVVAFSGFICALGGVLTLQTALRLRLVVESSGRVITGKGRREKSYSLEAYQAIIGQTQDGKPLLRILTPDPRERIDLLEEDPGMKEACAALKSLGKL